MNIIDAIHNRRSIRKFLDRDIEEEKIEQLIDALIWAPSAGNLQMRRFFFVSDRKKKDALSVAANQRFIRKAPLVVVGCLDTRIQRSYGDRGVHLYAIQDVSASIMNMMLMACQLDLGTVWVGAFDEERVTQILDLPDNLRPLSMVPVGYPAKVPSPPSRVRKSDAVVFI